MRDCTRSDSMRIVLYILCGLFGLALLYAAAALLTGCCKLWRRPIKRLYAAITSGEGYTPVSAMPEQLVRIVVRLEDMDFYTHKGISLHSIRWRLSMLIREHRFSGGGSTITQQLAKNLYFSFGRSAFRKLAELVIVRRLERVLTKDEILGAYLNIIYLGNGVYGVPAAARFYFDETAQELTLNQSILLATLLPGPTVRNPYVNPDRYVKAREKSLSLLYHSDIITEDEAASIRDRYPAAHPDDDLQPRTPVICDPPMYNEYIRSLVSRS